MFRRKEVDTAGFIENPDWVFDIKREKPELEFFRSWISGWINSRFKVFCAPFDDVRVRKAIHLATERQQIVDVIGSGEWRMQGPVGNAIDYWALPYEELLTLPGYRQGSASAPRTSLKRGGCTKRRAARSCLRYGSRTSRATSRTSSAPGSGS